MSPFVLDVLKIAFLALLYFFVYRAVRAVVVDVRGPRRPRRSETGQRSAPIAAPAPRGAGRRAAKPGKPPRKVVVSDGGGKRGGRSVPLEGTIQVGRAEGCGVRVDDTYVSQMHARIFSRDGAWFVEDLGSTNGTFLNERKVTEPAAVGAGDRVRVGKTVLELRS